jgi:mannose-6-phosphate isomerase-like protein (cupin superfamily)
MTQVVKEARPTTTFQLQAPLLDQGRTMELLAGTEKMYAHIKVYAEGGENTIHAHTQEDHMFVILAGQATFHLGPDDRIEIVGKHAGVMIPNGNYYWFESSGDENLVMLRVGARTGGWGGDDDRIGISGKPLPGNSLENKQTPVIVRPNAFFS